MTRNIPPRTRQISNPGSESRTDRGSGAGLDINEIVARAKRGQPLTTGMRSARQPFFADISSVDYVQSLNATIRVKQEFDRFPAEIRLRFGNDPAHLLAFLENPDNRPEAERLGLVAVKPPAPPSLADQVAEGLAKHSKAQKGQNGAE